MQQELDDGTTLHAIFPTLVFQTNLANHLHFKPLFESVFNRHSFNVDVGDGTQQPAGEYHGKVLLHKEQSLQPFFHEVSMQMCKYLSVLNMRFELFSMNVLKSWFTLVHPHQEVDEAITSHTHSCSDISFVYYLHVPADCPEINFHCEKSPNAFFDSAFHLDAAGNATKSSVTEINQWTADVCSLRPTEGDLIFFPGKQHHSVSPNHTDQIRISIAGDIALSLNDPHLEFEFGRTSPCHWSKYALQEIAPVEPKPTNLQFKIG